MIEFLLRNATGVTSGEPSAILDRVSERDEISIQVAFTGTASVKVYGRLHADLPWIEVLDVSVAGIYPISRVTWLYAEVATHSSGTVSCACYG